MSEIYDTQEVTTEVDISQLLKPYDQIKKILSELQTPLLNSEISDEETKKIMERLANIMAGVLCSPNFNITIFKQFKLISLNLEEELFDDLEEKEFNLLLPYFLDIFELMFKLKKDQFVFDEEDNIWVRAS